MDLLPAFLLLTALWSLYKYVWSPLFVSDLRKIPAAHPLARFTSAWIIWIRYKKRENRELLRLHKLHGPIILIGPNEISLNSVQDGIRVVYGGGFPKDEYYDQFANYSIRTMFSTLDGKAHAARKRLISHVYSKSYLMASPFLEKTANEVLLNRMLPILEKSQKSNSPAEMHELFHAVTMDLFTGYAFGLRTSTNFVQNVEYREEWRRNYRCRVERNIFTQDLAGIATLASYFGISLISKGVLQAIKYLEDWFMKICDQTGKLVESNKLDDGEAIVYRSLKDGLQKAQLLNEKGALPETPDNKGLITGKHEDVQTVVAAEIMDQCLAAFETSAITLTYFAYHISQNTDWQNRLYAELTTLAESHDASETLPPAADIDKLPVLHATLMETLRLRAAIPGAQPRRSPAGVDSHLAGYKIPGNVKINAQAYTLHREVSIFPDPEEWLPERWLADETAVKEMYRWLWAFSSGGRMCVGSNLAMIEMKAAIFAIWSRFSTVLAEEDDVEQEDGYTVGPISERLMAKFTTRTSNQQQQAPEPQVSIRSSIAWNGQEPFENTNTLTITGANGHFLDLRIFKTGNRVGQIEWALAGRAVEVEPTSEGLSRIHFQSVIDSHRTQMPKKVRDTAPPDIGIFSDLPSGDALETGAMVNVDDDYQVQPYREIWHRLETRPNAPTILLESVNTPKTFIGRVDRWSMAITEKSGEFGAWRFDCVDGEWRQIYNIREDLIPVRFRLLEPTLGKIGEIVKLDGLEWKVLESSHV